MRYIDASLIDERHLMPLGIWMKRGVAICLWLLSLIGTYVFINGNEWVLPDTQATLATLAIALMYQLFFSTAQFAWRQSWLSFWYLAALMASVIPSTLTYGRIDIPLWEAWKQTLLHMGISPTTVDVITWVFVFCLMVIVDAVPEQILVKRKRTHSTKNKAGQNHQNYQNYQRAYQRYHASSQQDDDLLQDILSQ